MTTPVRIWAKHARPDLPTDAVLDFLVENYHGPGTVYSPALVAKHVQGDESVLHALLLLSNAPTYVLKGQWVFFDPDSGDEIELAPEEVQQAVQDQEFFHPLSGDRVFSYMQSIGLVYQADRGLDELAAGTPKE